MAIPRQRSPSPDRRVRRTRESLRNALLALLVERGWDAIDVNALCDRADVARSTFYLHFANKEELLESGFGDMHAMLVDGADRGVARLPHRLAFVGGLVAHVHEQREAFRAILGRRSGHFVQERFRELLVEMVEAERLARGGRSWQSHAVSSYLGGALFQLLVWWLGAGRPHNPQEIEALFHELSESVLRR